MAIVGLIFKIIGIVLLSLILLLIILLHFSAVVRVHIGRDGLKWSVRYLGFTIAPRKKKSEKTDDTEDAPSEVYDEIDEEIELLDLEDDDLDKDIEKLEDKQPEKTPPEETAAEDKPEQKLQAEEKSDEEPEKAAEPEEKKQKTRKAKKEKSEKSDGKSKGGLRAKIDGLKAKYAMIKPYIPYTWKMFKKLLKIIRIRIDDVRLTVGREDAHEAVIFYGQTQAAVSNLLTMLGGMFTVKVKRCDINCRFAENYLDGNADISVRLRPSAAVWIVLLIAFNAAGIWIRQKLAARKAAKAAAAGT